MNDKLNLTIRKKNIFLYFILIPFLYPRGFDEFSTVYKTFFTAWLYGAMFLIFIIFLIRLLKDRVLYKKCIFFMLLYFLIFLIITLYIQGNITEGLQKLFAAPVLCLLSAMLLSERPKNFIKVVSNILIISFSLNLVIFNSTFWNSYFNETNHMTFLGHVQIAAQLGILGLFLSYITLRQDQKVKSRILLILSILTMLYSRTSASYFSLLILSMFYLIRKRNFIRKYLFNPKNFIFLFLALNIFILFLILHFTSGTFNNVFTLLTSGRTYIWRETLKVLNNHWILGFGAYGVNIKVFWNAWTNSQGMNYVHNELLQRILDGGIVLAISFILMIYNYIVYIKRCDDNRLVYWSYAFISTMSIVMLFESVTEYYYFYFLLSLVAYTNEISNIFNKKEILKWDYIQNSN